MYIVLLKIYIFYFIKDLSDLTLIVKNLLVSQMGYEIEMCSIPDRLKNEINVIIWKLIWDDKVNQIDRNVCCLDKKEGGMEMINIENITRSKQIKIICKIIHSHSKRMLEFYW